MTLLNLFAQNVRYYRQQAGLTQEKLGELAGLHRTYISDLERGLRSISIANIEKIAAALGTEPYLLFMKTDREAEK